LRSIPNVPLDSAISFVCFRIPVAGSKYPHLLRGVRYSPSPVLRTKVPQPRGHGETLEGRCGSDDGGGGGGGDFGAALDEDACCRTFTTSRGVTAKAVMVDPTEADTTLANAVPPLSGEADSIGVGIGIGLLVSLFLYEWLSH
jgi:hypothetical protein